MALIPQLVDEMDIPTSPNHENYRDVKGLKKSDAV